MTMQSRGGFGVISGATGFLGEVLAHHYAALGVNLILIGRSAERLEKLKSSIEESYKVSVLVSELKLEGDFTQDLNRDLTPISTQIDFFINTIGNQNPIGPMLNCSNSSWRMSIENNLIVPALLAKLFAGIFKTNGLGSIVLTSGGGATNARENFSAYASAKSGLVRFVETFALELSGTGVRINAISPGVMPSAMMKEVVENSDAAGDSETSKAEACLAESKWSSFKTLELMDFLISKASDGISGKIVSADWDNWHEWPEHIQQLRESDLYTLRRITGRDRNQTWGDI